jgi:hypothetical protein
MRHSIFFSNPASKSLPAGIWHLAGLTSNRGSRSNKWSLLEHPGLERKQHTSGVDLVPAQIVIGAVIARPRRLRCGTAVRPLAPREDAGRRELRADFLAELAALREGEAA